MNVSELQAVRDKIAQGWTRGVSARDGLGREITPYSEQAVCFCLLGAMAVSGMSLTDFREALGFREYGIAAWNDAEGRTQAEVLSRIDDAIARARSLKQEGN